MSSSQPIVLITGANRGIGFELARTLARDHSFHVLLGARNPSSGAQAIETLQAEGLSSVELLILDCSSDISIAAAAAAVEKRYGRIDVLVNNAGIAIDHTTMPPVHEIRGLFENTFDSNIFGAAVVSEAFVPLLSKSSLPRLIFMSSILGSVTHRVDPEGKWKHVSHIAYRCSKAALNMLCATYVERFRADGWKINAVCPGSVATDLNENYGVLTVQEAMPNLVRLCTMGEEGETGGFSDPEGSVPW